MATGLPDVVNDLSLPDDAERAHIKVLGDCSRKKLALHLDPEKEYNTTSNQFVDYRGLAELMGYSYRNIDQFSLSKKSATHALLDHWDNHESDPTIGKLWGHLITLHRYDVMEDCMGVIVQDVEQEMTKITERPLPADQVTGCSDHDVDGNLILTPDDVKYGKPQYYDAFVCCNLDGNEDMMFVHKMVDVLEKERGIRLCIPDRDSLPGSSKYEAYSSLIKLRCRMMIVVLSQKYLQSPAADFQVKFAQALAPATKKKKLVPVLIEKMEMPNILRALTLCDFTKRDMEEWNWDRLYNTLTESDKDWSSSAPTNSYTRPNCQVSQRSSPNTEQQTPTSAKTSLKGFFRNLIGKRK